MSRRLCFILVKKGIMPNARQSPNCAALTAAQLVKNLPAMQESWVQFLGQEDPLEKGMATHSSFLAWRIPWTEEGTVHGVAMSPT